jgi:hypothetical protein
MFWAQVFLGPALGGIQSTVERVMGVSDTPQIQGEVTIIVNPKPHHRIFRGIYGDFVFPHAVLSPPPVY